MKRYQEPGTDEILILMQIGCMPPDRIMRSIDLIATEMIPKFRDAESKATFAAAQPSN